MQWNITFNLNVQMKKYTTDMCAMNKIYDDSDKCTIVETHVYIVIWVHGKQIWINSNGE